MRTLPPGLTAADFAKAVSAFKAVVGEQWVFTSAEDLDTYRDPYSLRWGDPDEYLASAAIAPDEVQQVQAIVKIANQFRIPLYPISTGKNLTYGAAAPTFTGSIVLDLKRMNRILKVDDKRNFALLEPGVSYFDLYNYIQEHDLKVWVDTPDPGWGSPIGNALDHGVGYTASPFRDHFGSHCGMEVVLPTGELMRTGMGALPTADSWQDYRYGVGPYIDGLFSQANFGIVTKMGFWLYPQPETWFSATASVPRFGDMQKLIEEVGYLEDSHLMTGQAMYSSPYAPSQSAAARFSNPAAGAPAAQSPDLTELMQQGWPTRENIEHFIAQHGLPAWRVKLQFYGPEKTVRANWEYAQQRIRAAIPGATFDEGELLTIPLTPEQQKTHHLVNYGIPNMAIFAMIERRESDRFNPPQGHVDFLCILPRSADALFRAQKTLYETQKATGMPAVTTPFGGPITWYHRAFLIGAPTTVNSRDDREKNKRSRAVFETYIKNMAAAGFGEYRTNSAMQGLLVAQFSFNDHALLRFQERLKDAADPNGIISPGRYGIWPKHLRQEKNS